MFNGKRRDKVVTYIRMLMNIENFFLQRFCGEAFYPIFRMLLSEAKINTNYEKQKAKPPMAIKAEVEIQPEEEQIMAHVYTVARRIYINVTTINDKDKGYEEQMRKEVGELKMVKEKRKSDCQARKQHQLSSDPKKI